MVFNGTEFLLCQFIWSLVENWKSLLNSNPQNQLHKLHF